jgi:hypothetical protein
MRRRDIFGTAVLAAFIAAACCTQAVFCDETEDDPASSGKSQTNIGAWYDETWDATKFYRLERVSSSSDNFRYVFKEKNAMVNESPALNATYTKDDASIPQDIVVTEWEVTGHVHFSSGL